MIKLRGIVFAYPRGPRALDGLDFDFAEGERIALTGANGAGKTTLLHILTGLLKPQSGTIEAFGAPRVSEADFFDVRRRVGLLFQDPNDQLFSPTVAEDVAFGPFNLGIHRHEVREIVRETLETVGLSGFENRITYRLSGGEKRLVSIATVLAMKPQAMLLDEPTAGLDEPTAERVLRVIDESVKSLIVISHDRATLDRLTNRRVVLKDGKIIEERL